MKRLFTYLLFAIGLFAMNVQASTTDGIVELKHKQPFPPNHNGPRWAPRKPSSDTEIPFSVILSDGIMNICSVNSATNVTVSFLDDKGNTVEEYLNCSLGVSPYLIDLSFLSLGDYSVVISENGNSYIGFFTVVNDIKSR